MKKFSISKKAFAKINLTLEVVSKRPDGYHNISSVMHSIALCDNIFVNFQDSDIIVISSNSQVLPLNEDNTIYKAAALMKKRYNIDKGMEIFVEKNIPQSAGLGGGSADAACIINMIDEEFKLGLSYYQKIEIAASIGSDVPFCLNNGAMLVEGKGERLSKLVPLPDFSALLVKIPVDVSAKEAYEDWDGISVFGNSSKKCFLEELMREEKSEEYWVANLSGYIYNSFTDIIYQKHEMLRKIEESLKTCGAFVCNMSGSGPAIFALFDDYSKLEEANSKIELLGFQPIVTSLCST